MGWYWFAMNGCGLKPLSIKDGAPIIDRTGKVFVIMSMPPEGDKSVDLKIDGYDAAGKCVLVLEMLVGFGLLMEGNNNQKTIAFFGPGMFNLLLNFNLKPFH